jgi:hypothetical protein
LINCLGFYVPLKNVSLACIRRRSSVNTCRNCSKCISNLYRWLIFWMPWKQAYRGLLQLACNDFWKSYAHTYHHTKIQKLVTKSTIVLKCDVFLPRYVNIYYKRYQKYVTIRRFYQYYQRYMIFCGYSKMCNAKHWINFIPFIQKACQIFRIHIIVKF